MKVKAAADSSVAVNLEVTCDSACPAARAAGGGDGISFGTLRLCD